LGLLKKSNRCRKMGFLFVSLPESNFKYSILRRLKKLFQHPLARQQNHLTSRNINGLAGVVD